MGWGGVDGVAWGEVGGVLRALRPKAETLNDGSGLQQEPVTGVTTPAGARYMGVTGSSWDPLRV